MIKKTSAYLFSEINPGLTKQQLMKLILQMPDDGYFTPHSIINDDLLVPNVFGFLHYQIDQKVAYDEGDIESINITASQLIGRVIPENQNKMYEASSGHKIFIDREKLTIKEVEKRRKIIPTLFV